jgi:tetratricopeptide (TPR) repeat protein
LAEGAKALALDPNDADSYAALAGALSLAGDADEALTMIDRATRLNPRSPGFYYYIRGLAEFGRDNFSRAAEAFEEAIRLNPEDRWAKRMIVATYGHLGRKELAAAIIEEEGASWFGTDPFTVRAVTFWYPYRERSDVDRLVEGLRGAGLPE